MSDILHRKIMTFVTRTTEYDKNHAAKKYLRMYLINGEDYQDEILSMIISGDF